MGHITCYYTLKTDLGGFFTYSLTPITIGEFTCWRGPPAINFAQGPRWVRAGPALENAYNHAFFSRLSIQVCSARAELLELSTVYADSCIAE